MKVIFYYFVRTCAQNLVSSKGKTKRETALIGINIVRACVHYSLGDNIAVTVSEDNLEIA